MNIQHWVLAFLWILYGVIHSLTATVFFKRFIQRNTGRYFIYYRLVYSVFALVSLLLIVYYQFSIYSFNLFDNTLFTLSAASTGIVAGILIMAYCIYQYFVLLSGVAVLINKNEKPFLKTNGLNKYMRHPLYFGTLLLLWSLFLLFPLLCNLVACGAITLYIIPGIYFEEKKLIDLFGDQYRLYKKEVPMLIPFLPGKNTA